MRRYLPLPHVFGRGSWALFDSGSAQRVARAIERVGAPASLISRGEPAGFLCSVQPVRDRSLQPLREGPWGIDRRRRAAMFAAPGEVADTLRVEDRLRWQGQNYRVLQVETVEFAGEPLYIWAMLEQQGRENNAHQRVLSTANKGGER